jgi:hypothetical protein
MQVEKIEGETSKITIVVEPSFPNKGWFIPGTEDYVYVRTETEYLLELKKIHYQIIDSKTLLVPKLNNEDTQDIQASFTGLKQSFGWIASWATIKIE